MRTIFFEDLGEVAYDKAWDYQESLLKANLDIKAAWYNSPDTKGHPNLLTKNHLLFCSHPHVYTLGKSGHMENLLVNDSRLKELNVSFFKTNRGWRHYLSRSRTNCRLPYSGFGAIRNRFGKVHAESGGGNHKNACNLWHRVW